MYFSNAENLIYAPGPALYGDDGYFGRLASLLETKCKDDLTKETFVEKTPAKKILFRLTEGPLMVIEGGALIVQSTRFNLWMSSVDSFDLDSIL